MARNNVGAAEPLPVVLAQEGITQAEYDTITTNPQYTRYLDTYTRELKENGFSFAAKCRVLAEELLPTLYKIATDTDAPAAARVKSIENLVTWADLKPKENASLSAGAGFSISININGSTTTVSASANPSTLPQADVVDVPVVSLPAEPVLQRPVRNFTPLALLEPDDYVYAGDDIDAPPLTAAPPTPSAAVPNVVAELFA